MNREKGICDPDRLIQKNEWWEKNKGKKPETGDAGQEVEVQVNSNEISDHPGHEKLEKLGGVDGEIDLTEMENISADEKEITN